MSRRALSILLASLIALALVSSSLADELASHMDATPLDNVRDSTAPLYVAYGGREPNLHAGDLFVLEALRQQPTRPLRYVVVEDGDHGFSTSNGRAHFAEVFDGVPSMHDATKS